MKRQDIWALEIHYWPSAAAAGLKPMPGFYLGMSDHSAHYVPVTFNFVHPPSREDFSRVRGGLAWTVTWENELTPLIEAHPWPYVDAIHKSANQELFNAKGEHVGRVRVRKNVLNRNEVSLIPTLSLSIETHLTCRMRAEDRRHADYLLLESQNRVRENMIKAGDFSEDRQRYEQAMILFEAGLRKTKPKPPE